MKRIHVIATGGTIAGKGKNIYDLTDYVSGVVPIADILSDVDDLPNLAQITYEDFCQIGSEDMTKAIWLSLAKRVNQLADDANIDGIVITHGTDTMEETAFFLNLVTATAKPIVLTGAMLPTTASHPDGPANLKDAIMVAADSKALNNNVLVVMNHNIFSATGVRKIHSSSVDAFAAPTEQRLGYVKKQVIWQQQLPKTEMHFDISQISELPATEIITVYGDMNVEIVKQMLDLGLNKIVFDCFGNGTMPKPLVELLAESDGIFISTTQTGSGKAEHSYPNLICGHGYTAKQARIILMLALTKTTDKSEMFSYFK